MSVSYQDPEEGFALFVLDHSYPSLGNGEGDSLALSSDGRFTLLRHTLTADDLFAVMQVLPIGWNLLARERGAIRLEDDIPAAQMWRSDFFLFSRRPNESPQLIRNLTRAAAAGVFHQLLQRYPDRLIHLRMTEAETRALLDSMTPPWESIPPERCSAPHIQPSRVTAPIPARSDDGAIFSLLADVGPRAAVRSNFTAGATNPTTNEER